VTAKPFIMLLQEISYTSNKCCYFEPSIHQRILKNNNHITMISEGSCDTED